MTDFDRQLHEALKRRQPPRDLTDAILARLEPPRPKPGLAWRWVPAAVAIAAMLIAGVGMYRLDQYRKGQEAKRELMVALGVTAQKLAVAEQRVNELNHRRIGYE
jgi:hypothetical protein